MQLLFNEIKIETFLSSIQTINKTKIINFIIIVHAIHKYKIYHLCLCSKHERTKTFNKIFMKKYGLFVVKLYTQSIT